MRKGSSGTDNDVSNDDECQLRKSGLGNPKYLHNIIPRPNASAGYWVCCLLPLALASNFIHGSDCAEASSTQRMVAIAAAGMCIESLCFFLYVRFQFGWVLKLLVAFLPGLLTSLLYVTVLQSSWQYGLFWGFAVTFSYQNIYIRVMRGLPRCFSYGEAALLVQGLTLFVLNGIQQIPNALFVESAKGEFSQLSIIMVCALFWLLVCCCLLINFNLLRSTGFFYISMVALLLAVTCFPITEPIPIVVLFNFIVMSKTRIYTIVLYVILVGLTVATVCWQIGSERKASTRIRKIFHALIVLVYIPGVFYECTFLYIASGVALAIFTVLELFRICDVPPLGQHLRTAFASFSDEKDAGILALTPFSLLIGCSLPIWISPCPCSGNHALLSLLAGVLTIGLGDSAASVIGSKFGRTKWKNSSRSLEGTLAFILTMLFTVFGFHLMGKITMTYVKFATYVLATLITALIEAHINQIDNLVLPLVFYIIVSVV